MPSFKNTFGKEETDKNLTYDNTAFLHFSISISVALIALLVCMLVHHFMSDKHSKRLRQAKSLPMFSKQVQIEKKLELRRILEGGAINKILLIVALVIVTCLGFQYVREQGTTLKGFDPYELLGVQLDTPIEKIKKAYRKLALELHPDRNPNNHEVSAKFIMVSKAYECLTDEKVKVSCQKYGNPDGQQSFKVGIALPSFLIEKQNNIVVMCWTFVLILLVIPKLLLNWNFKLQAKDQRGVLLENYQIMYYYLRRELTSDIIDNMIVSLKEAEDLQKDNQKSQKTESNKQVQELEKQTGLQQLKVFLSDKAKKNLEILRQYRQGKRFEAELVKKFPELLRELIVFSIDFCIKDNKKHMIFINHEGKKVYAPFVGISVYDNLIRYSQEFYQNSKRTEHGLNQLSLPSQKIEQLKKKYTIRDIVKLEQTRENFFKDLQGNEYLKHQISEEISCMPSIDFKVTTFAGKQPETVFTRDDIAFFKFIINRKSEGNPAGIAYTPKFPYLKQEKYYITLKFQDTMVFFEEVTILPGQTYEAGYRYVHRGPLQKMKFTASLCSDCYFGLDQEQDIELTYVKYTGSNIIEFHPVDKRLEHMPMNEIEAMLSFDINGAAEDELLSDSEETAIGNEQTGDREMHAHAGGCCDHNHGQDNEEQEEEHVHGDGCQHQHEDSEEQWVDEEQRQQY